MTYASTYGSGDYAGTVSGTADVAALTQLGAKNIVDPVVTTGAKSGYNFRGGRTASSATGPGTFFFTANPLTTSGITATGTRRFGIATDGVVRFDSAAANLATQFTDVTVSAASAF